MAKDQSIEIGKKTEAYLKTIDMSPTELANKLGVTPQYVYNVLNGKQLGRKSAVKWGNILGVNSNWFLTGEGDLQPTQSEGHVDTSQTEKVLLEIIKVNAKEIKELAMTVGKLQAELEFEKKQQ